MKSDILLSLIKEVVKNEVKTQVRQQVISEITKLVKSGTVTLNSNRKPQAPTLKEAIKSVDPFTEATRALQKSRASVPQQQRVQQPQKEYTKNSTLNEILNMTTPFTSAQRAEGGAGSGASVLDMLQPQMSMEEDGWETMDYRESGVPQSMPQQLESTGDALQDATMKALTRDYSELVKRFK
jgi:hypothetical protein